MTTVYAIDSHYLRTLATHGSPSLAIGHLIRLARLFIRFLWMGWEAFL
jgi:hypothetical protein